MNTYNRLVREFIATLDHALYLQCPRTAWSTTTIGSARDIGVAWAKYHDARYRLETYMVLMERIDYDSTSDAYEAMRLASMIED